MNSIIVIVHDRSSDSETLWEEEGMTKGNYTVRSGDHDHDFGSRDPENRINSANNLIYLSVDQPLLHPLVLRTRLQGHGVHAPLTAVVAHSQPVLLDSLQVLVPPREEVSAKRRETLRSPSGAHSIE